MLKVKETNFLNSILTVCTKVQCTTILITSISNINHFTVVLYHQPFCIWEVWKNIKESRVAILYPLSLFILSTTSPEWRVGLEEIDDHKDMDLISQISNSLFVVGVFFVLLRPPTLYSDLFPPISSQSLHQQTLERRFPNNFKHRCVGYFHRISSSHNCCFSIIGVMLKATKPLGKGTFSLEWPQKIHFIIFLVFPFDIGARLSWCVKQISCLVLVTLMRLSKCEESDFYRHYLYKSSHVTSLQIV